MLYFVKVGPVTVYSTKKGAKVALAKPAKKPKKK